MPPKVAIVGAGVAGCYLAQMLARNGVAVDLVDPQAPWSKPCGGGITAKAVAAFPLLAPLAEEAEGITRFRLIAPSGREAELESRVPLWLLPRERLNAYLLEAAEACGARRERHRVVHVVRREDGRWLLEAEHAGLGPYDHVVGADGAVSTVRRALDRPFAREDLILALDHHLGATGVEPHVAVAFFGRGMGYLWAFFARDYASVGIGAPAHLHRRGELEAKLRRFLAARYPGLLEPKAQPVRWVIPYHRRGFLDRYRIQGEGWSLVGDAAGLADPLTGEGIYHALRSARLLAEAFLLDQPADYEAAVRRDLVPELEKGHAIARDYFRPWILELLVAAARRSRALRDFLAEYLTGAAPYREARTRLRRRRRRILKELLGLRR